MDEQSYENNEILEYLLGSLPEVETERFDELSFTDERFAGALDAAENDLLDRYARGELAGDELAQFKTYYLASPLRREKAAFAETFQIYAERNQAKAIETSRLAESKSEKKSGGFFSFLNGFKNQNLLPRLGLAFAALLLLITGGFLFLKSAINNETAKQTAPSNVRTEQPEQTQEKQSANTNEEVAAVNAANQTTTPQKNSNVQPARSPEPEKPNAPPKIIVASFVLSPSVRGDDEIKSLSIAKETTEINMNLELEADDFPVYLVALADETGGVKLWRGGKVKAAGKGENKFLSVRFPARLLKSKIYSLVVSGVKSDGGAEIISNYPFRAVLK